MYTYAALSAAHQAAGTILSYIRVRQLPLPAVSNLTGLGVKTHFRDQWFRPLLAPWTVHQCNTRTPSIGFRLKREKV